MSEEPKQGDVKQAWAGCLTIIVAVWGFFYLKSCTTSTTSGLPKPSTFQDLRAGAACREGKIWITNLEPWEWREVKIEINRDWTANIAEGPAPGQTQSYLPFLFTKSDGERFNPFTHSCKTVDIHVTPPAGGRAHWNGAWSR